MSKHFIPIAANEDDDVPAFVPTAKPASERAHRLHGLGFGLERIEFALSDEGRVLGLDRLAAEAGSPREWQLRPLEPVPGVVGCLAWRGPPRIVQRLRFAP